MRITDRELNKIVDEVTAEIRDEQLDAAIVSGAAQRVWSRLSGEQAAAEIGVSPVEQIRSCEDFQTLIPAYLHGILSAARTMLLEDHVNECVPCRKALKTARHGNPAARQLEIQQAQVSAANYRMTVLRWGVAAVLIVGLGMVAWPWARRFMNSVGTLHAIVEAANGSVYKVSGNATQSVKIGEKLLRGERLRTAKDSRAMLKLADGTLIEMRERAECSITDNAAGQTINLERGNIIVEAAKQRDRKLFVATDDALVSVTGTIFSVNHGTKGARVSVIEGEVHVNQDGREQILHAGQQLTTHPSIERNSVRDEVAWSRDADRYLKMLDAVRNQIDQQVPLPGNRYSTRLLDLMPENAVLYVAIPNLSETLKQANQILQENLEKNAELSAWWEKEQSNRRHGLREAIDLVRDLGGYLGDEIALGVESGPGGGEPKSPIVMAELRDASGFRTFVENRFARFNVEGKDARIIDDPATAKVDQSKPGLLVWISQDLVAVAPELGSLQSLSSRLKQSAKPFAGSAFHGQIAELYREGAGLVIAADLDRLVVRSIRREPAAATAEQLGVTDLRYFIVEVKEKDGKPFNRAVVSYKESQHGLTSWLAQPGPMGALEFISPDANIVAAFVVKRPAALVDDLLNTLKSVDEHAYQRLQETHAQHGVNLRDDFAAPLGGEFAFAIDGPMLPMPSWKMVFEVDDPAHLQQTLERSVEKINSEFVRDGKKGLAWSRAESGGRTFHTLRSLDLNLEVNYTYVYGYLIVAPSRALVENAIKYRESGYTLLHSSKFKSTLPEDRQANFSAMVYQNIASVAGPVAKIVGNSGAPEHARNAIKDLLGKKAGLAYIYAFNDRAIFSINTEGGPLGLSTSDLLALPGSSGLGHILRGATH
ncbi:MAG TPA: FecR domain-containing protein [Blastocatellia bacterium]|nr:FecR domain-containing protein [Blastocatellia bacterium]